MKECLWCKKEYEPKKETSKFCSTSCRVMWNRKYGKKKNQVTSDQLQELYNSVLAAVNAINALNDQPPAFASVIVPEPSKTSFMQNEPPSFESRLYAAETIEELQQVGMDIQNSRLPFLQKQRLQNIGKQIFQNKFNF